MRIGVSGLGFGKHLLSTLLTRDDCTVVGAADEMPDRLAYPQARNIETFDSATRMIEKCKLDAIVIASAPHIRETALQAALVARLPIFIEKPIAGTPQDAKRIEKLCGDAKVMMGFSFRFHDPVQRLIEILHSSELGNPMLLNAEYMFDWLPPFGNWLWDEQRGGGFFNENSCHLFDVVVKLLGQPIRVYAEAVADERRSSPTGAAVTMKFASGAAAAITLGGIGTSGMNEFPRLDLACTEGQAKMRGREHMWVGLTTQKRGGTANTYTYEPEVLSRTRYSAAFDNFFACIQAGKPFQATPADGVATTELAHALYHSLATGQPVNL